MGILGWWRKRSGGGAGGGPDREIVDETIERVVQTTNPRLKLARRFRATLAPAVETALAYTGELVNAMPAPREASSAGWASDPYMQAFFATADDLVQIFSRAPLLRGQFEQNPGMPEAYALLGMRMTERKVLAKAMEGDQVRGEVTQTTVSFGDHRIRVCGATEPELRAELERRLLDQLAIEGLAGVIADQSNRTELEQERAVLKARLQMLERKGTGMRGLGGESVGVAELTRLQSQLTENTTKLGGTGGGTQALERELEQICAVLAEPAKHLYVSSKRLRINNLNVVVEEGGTEFEFLLGQVPGITPPEMRAFTLARFPRAELLPQDRLIDDAARLLA
jgi:hypothetical protein